MKLNLKIFYTKRITILLTIWISLLVLVISQTFASILESNKYKGLLLNPAKQIKSYPLLNHDGNKVNFPSASGKYQLILFGYTSCPDVCPMTLLKIRQVIQSLPNESRVTYNFVSIDIERDNPTQLKEFVTYFDPRITGFTGSIHNIKSVEKEFGILTRKFQGSTALAYKLEHSVFMYLVDPYGKLILMYPGSTNAQQITSDLNMILHVEQGPNN